MAIKIRDADERDIPSLAELSRFAQDLHVAALPDHFKQPESDAASEWMRAKLRREDARTWVACLGHAVVGYVVVAIRERQENALCRARRAHEIEEIVVSPAHRRQGVARALVDRVLEDARLRGIRDVELTSWSFNVDAHRAFEALGFRPMLVRFGRESE